jgi:hypothetical protein
VLSTQGLQVPPDPQGTLELPDLRVSQDPQDLTEVLPIRALQVLLVRHREVYSYFKHQAFSCCPFRLESPKRCLLSKEEEAEEVTERMELLYLFVRVEEVQEEALVLM